MLLIQSELYYHKNNERCSTLITSDSLLWFDSVIYNYKLKISIIRKQHDLHNK